MAFKTAQDIRNDINTPPTQDELSDRYRIAEILIVEQVQYGFYAITFTMGSEEIAVFSAFMRGLGYFTRTLAPSDVVDAEFPIRSPAPGDTVSRVTVSWSKYTVTPTVTTAQAGDTVTFNITTEGVTSGTILYWSILTALPTNNYTPNLGSVTLAANGSATQPITLSTPLTQSGSLLFKLYRDSARLELVAEATAVTVQA